MRFPRPGREDRAGAENRRLRALDPIVGQFCNPRTQGFSGGASVFPGACERRDDAPFPPTPSSHRIVPAGAQACPSGGPLQPPFDRPSPLLATPKLPRATADQASALLQTLDCIAAEQQKGR
jgi:hypothetical protein